MEAEVSGDHLPTCIAKSKCVKFRTRINERAPEHNFKYIFLFQYGSCRGLFTEGAADMASRTVYSLIYWGLFVRSLPSSAM